MGVVAPLDATMWPRCEGSSVKGWGGRRGHWLGVMKEPLGGGGAWGGGSDGTQERIQGTMNVSGGVIGGVRSRH